MLSVEPREHCCWALDFEHSVLFCMAVLSSVMCFGAAAWWFQKPNTVRAEASLKLDDNNRIWGA